MGDYQGWTNYETWAVNLWMDNNEGSYNYVREQAREAIAEAKSDRTEYLTVREQATYALAETLKGDHEEGNPLAEDGASVYTDLLNAALSEVNWQEIAGNVINEIADDDADDKQQED